MLFTRKAAPVDVEPESVLTHYRIFAADDGRHFAGVIERTGKARVSTFIVDWDPDNMVGTTSSGRRYRLSGPPGTNGIAEYAWRTWSSKYGIDESTDVTDEYSPAARPGLN